MELGEPVSAKGLANLNVDVLRRGARRWGFVSRPEGPERPTSLSLFDVLRGDLAAPWKKTQ